MLLRIMVVVWAVFAFLNLTTATIDGPFNHDYARASYEVGMTIIFLMFSGVTAYAAEKEESENHRNHRNR